MSEHHVDPAPDDAQALPHALVALHALAGTYGENNPSDAIPGFRPLSPQENLEALAGATTEDVSISARLDILHRLARANRSEDEAIRDGYYNLAESVIREKHLSAEQLTAEQLVRDLQASATNQPSTFASTESAKHFDHHEIAFIGEDVCTVKRVKVGGIDAVWVFSEFETNAAFGRVAQWVDPRHWKKRGPMLFKEMEIPGGADPVDIKPGGDQHWHSVFHEEVQLVRRVNTLLHCDYRLDTGQTAGMTYELEFSLDNEINVDRGYLLVNEVDGVRRVKALKIVGFTNPVWNAVALFVCPFWTDWVRQAAEGGSLTSAKPPTQSPPVEGGQTPLADTVDAWVEFFGDSARSYLEILEDVTDKCRSGEYPRQEQLDDGRRYWSQLATDWARAWKNGMETLEEVADEGLDAGFTPPGVPRQRGRGAASALTTARGTGLTTSARSVVQVAGLAGSASLVVSDLVSIEAGGATIPSTEVRVTVQPLADGTPAVHLSTGNTTAPVGLYLGHLLGPGPGAGTPVQLYVSRAEGAPP